MKRIALLSGKGGTGKTSIAAAFGHLAGSSAVLCDCDVDAANLPIVCSQNTIYTEYYSGGHSARIDANTCLRCGKCAAACRFQAIEKRNGDYSVTECYCEGCGFCALICPEKAITMEPVRSGEVFLSASRFGSFIAHAELDTGAENSGKLSSRVRAIGDQKAAENKCDYIIIDGPPGISCPAIAAAAGTDYVLFVTEPSLSGISDVKRAYELTGKMKLKSGVIVNRCDINAELTLEIEKLSAKMNVEYLGAIPWSGDFLLALKDKKAVTEYSKDKRIIDRIKLVWSYISTNKE